MRRLLTAAIALAGFAVPASGQISGVYPPFQTTYHICPTAPVGDSSKRCASTEFVANAIGTPTLTANRIFIGGATNLSTEAPMTGDCTISLVAGNAAIVCTKTNGVAFAASATVNTTDATNITAGILPLARLSGSYTGITGTGTLAAGATGAGFTVNFGASTLAGTIPIANGGLAQATVPANGRIPIGNGTGYTVANLTAGANITINNSAGGIEIAAAAASSTPCTTTALSIQYNAAGALGCVAGVTSDSTAISFSSGNLKLLGASSGTSVLNAPATGGGTNTLPPGTDILAGLTATQAISNKTIPSTANTLDSNQLKGTATNDAASAGNMGELLSAARTSASPLALSSTVSANVTSALSLTPGDWDVWGFVTFTGGSTTGVFQLIGAINTVSATLPAPDTNMITKQPHYNQTPFLYVSELPVLIGPTRVTVAAATDYYLIANGQFGVSTLSAYGAIYARRRR